ncbi:hypothetical protein INR49_014677 [Caranx melampygus]|nr:hypothetical protein INR49_014677 [Caranx melampygus]
MPDSGPSGLTHGVVVGVVLQGILPDEVCVCQELADAHLFYVDRFGEGLEAAVQNQTPGDIAQEEAKLSQHVLLLL